MPAVSDPCLEHYQAEQSQGSQLLQTTHSHTPHKHSMHSTRLTLSSSVSEMVHTDKQASSHTAQSVFILGRQEAYLAQEAQRITSHPALCIQFNPTLNKLITTPATSYNSTLQYLCPPSTVPPPLALPATHNRYL